MKLNKWLIGMVLILLFTSLGLKGKERGQENVDQGRVIQFDQAKGVVKVIANKSTDHLNPRYNSLPPLTYTLPASPQEIGFLPKAGLRLNLDTKHNEIVIFDEANQKIKKLTYTLVDQKENIAKNNPLVLENGKFKKFPLVDREKKLITIYSERQRILTTLILPAEYFSLPEYTWQAGDEVLVHYQGKVTSKR
jgi:hypothetical protein